MVSYVHVCYCNGGMKMVGVGRGRGERSLTDPLDGAGFLPGLHFLGGLFFLPPGCTVAVPSPALRGTCDTHAVLIATSVQANNVPGAS